MLVLSQSDVAEVCSFDAMLEVVADAFRAQGRGAVERPERPHFPVGKGRDDEEPPGTGLAMPAYIHGNDYYATKLASVFPGNEARGLPTVQAQLQLSDAETGTPAAYMAATHLTAVRTGCIAGLAARELAVEGPVRLGVVGAGAVARASTRAIAAATDLESVSVYSPSASKDAFAADLSGVADEVRAVDSAEAAVESATVVVTATTSETPVFDGEALEAGTLVVALGAYTPDMQEIDATTVRNAVRIFGDVPEEVAETGDMRDVGVDASAIVPFASVLSGEAGRESPSEILLVDSVGSAVLDAAAAEHVYEEAAATGVGREIEL
ncbi:ornithine cyclodeaminase family protein [Natronomonas sp.]|uniref:ornithine cyclodeaminase family protein n=1 Tax=Natronomonas sp. TaxID=2184060 RepID=UPI002FC314CD